MHLSGAQKFEKYDKKKQLCRKNNNFKRFWKNDLTNSVKRNRSYGIGVRLNIQTKLLKESADIGFIDSEPLRNGGISNST